MLRFHLLTAPAAPYPTTLLHRSVPCEASELLVYEHTHKFLIVDKIVWVSSCKTSQYSSRSKAPNTKRVLLQQKPQLSCLILCSDHHRGCCLWLWSTDCVSAYSLLYVLRGSADERPARFISHIKPFIGFIPLTLSRHPIWAAGRCRRACVDSVIVNHRDLPCGV